MGVFHDEMRVLAVDLITEFGDGHKAALIRASATYDPHTGNEVRSEARHEVVAVTADAAKDSDPALVARGALTVYLPAVGLAIVPAAGDQIELPGRTGRYAVARVGTFDPDGDQIAYQLTVARP